ncbi:Axial regulator YABBY 4 [Spatholobus suberectus]|nr:Axial regulator YABBY 4 [Spatholobus suberectus]
MSTLNQLFDLPEQICYVQCGFCTTTLMVSVPCSSLSMVVTVRCGHCTSLLSVNMLKASFVPFHLLASLTHVEPKEGSSEDGANKTLNSYNAPITIYSDCEEENVTQMNNVVNKPPEKRQRTPSAYNRFIKEEIKRLKAENPNMAHKEAFSTAAKNPVACIRTHSYLLKMLVSSNSDFGGPIFPHLSVKEMQTAVTGQSNLWIWTPA